MAWANKICSQKHQGIWSRFVPFAVSFQIHCKIEELFDHRNPNFKNEWDNVSLENIVRIVPIYNSMNGPNFSFGNW